MIHLNLENSIEIEFKIQLKNLNLREFEDLITSEKGKQKKVKNWNRIHIES